MVIMLTNIQLIRHQNFILIFGIKILLIYTDQFAISNQQRRNVRSNRSIHLSCGFRQFTYEHDICNLLKLCK